MVERLLAKEKVESSNLFARSILLITWRRGQAGKARVCKTLITGSSPVDASKKRSRVPPQGIPSMHLQATSVEVAFCIEFIRKEIDKVSIMFKRSIRKELSLE